MTEDTRHPIRVPEKLYYGNHTLAGNSFVLWLKKEGDEVSQGEQVAHVDTAKKVYRIDAPCDGIVDEVVVPSMKFVKPSDLLGYVRQVEPGA